MKKQAVFYGVSLFLFLGLSVTPHLYAQSGNKFTIAPAGLVATDTSFTLAEREQHDKVKTVATQRKWTEMLYSLLFKDPENINVQENDRSIDEQFDAYDGLIISDIRIIVLAPFGTNIYQPDDSIHVDNRLAKAANNLHIETKHYIVRSNLLFKVGDAINPLVMAESEVFLRNTDYIHDARIQVVPIPGTNMADVTVVVRDVFSIGFDLRSVSLNSADISLYDRNFLGVGSRFWVRGVYDADYANPFGYGIGYRYNNLSRTFINLEGSYMDNIWDTEILLQAERPLQISLSYFGQASYNRVDYRLSMSPWDSVSPPLQETMSVTLGRAFDLERSTAKRLAIALRYIDYNASYTPVNGAYPIPLQYEYATRQSYIGKLSFFSQRYHKQYMVHQYGVGENIAYGYNISGQFGYTKCPNFFEGMYASVEVSAGNLFKFGNLYADVALAWHFSREKMYQGVVQTNVNYFTPLFRLGVNRMRGYANLNYVTTLRPIDGLVDYVYFSTLSTLNTGFFDNSARGIERLMLDLRADFFSNLSVFGFRVLLFPFYNGGWLKTHGKLIASSNYYQGFGVGASIRNDLLVFPTVVLKLGFYPHFGQGFGNMFQVGTSEPDRSPTFVPSYPEEIIVR